jgi:DNA repair and recombination protein RAD54B
MKKNKTWDGDGVLSVVNGYAKLQDVSGRELGRIAWKQPLLPGSTLSIAGREIEVESMISKADFLAGKPFLNKTMSSKSQVDSQMPPARAEVNIGVKKEKEILRELHSVPKRTVDFSRVASTAFKSPLIVAPKMQAIAPSTKPVPRHDPNAPGAFVLPRPSYVPKGKQIVDVVVDPILSRHLRPHQREGVQFIYECVMGMRLKEGQGAILADEMGLGKTLQTIALIWTLLKQNPIHEATPVAKKVLVVCPVTLINNWRKEFRKWLGNDRIGVFIFDDKRSRITDFTKGRAYNVMIVGYEKLRTIQDELKSGCEVDLIIADEGHRLKTAQNKAALAIKSLDTDRRIVLTGTPMQNDLSEFHAMVDLVNPGIFSKYTTFKRDFENPIVKGRQPEATKEEVEKGEACSEELAALTNQFILRRTAEVIAQYLPPKTEMIVFCRPAPAQATIYKAVLASPYYGAVLGSSDASFQLINILKKLCNSPALLSKTNNEEAKPNELIRSILDSVPPQQMSNGPASSAKLKLLQSLLSHLRQTTNEKIVVVSNYTATLDIIERLITSLGYKFLRLDGQTPASKRQDLVDKFNKTSASSCFAFLLSAKAGGTGLNLVGASRLVLYDIDWNPATDLQAMARIHRDGQTKPCFIYRLVIQGAIEEKIYQRQVAKTGLSDSVVDSKKTAQGFTTEELRDLFRLDESETCPTHDLLGCDCNGMGNTRVLPENSSDDPISNRPWGSTMGDPGADEMSENDDDDVNLGVMISAAKLNLEAQERQVQKMLRKSKSDGKNGKILALMQYLHINAAKVSSGYEDLEALIEDQVLLQVLKQQTNKVAFIFSKTSG